MKRGMALLLTLWALLAPLGGHAEEIGNDWAMITAALASDDPRPVPDHWQLTVGGLSLAPDLPGGVMNLLLLGTDSPAAEESRGRTEVMLLCSVDTTAGDMKLIALPETAYVTIDGLPGPIRLKYAHCFGGPQLAMKTVNEALQLNVSRYCTVNFESFIAVIDQLGGVTLTLTDAEREVLGIAPDAEALNGAEALRYVKLRWGEAVTDRPRILLAALLQKALSGGIDGAFSLAESVLPSIDTNLTTGDLVDLVFALAGSEQPGGFSAMALPAEGDQWPPDAAAWCRGVLYGEGALVP
ncbi:MAG: LCP family protein [Clostridia bacterium]|nr:LCP family protein [Clostridia bacterium]